MNLYELGQSLKNARIQKQLTQNELAQRTGLSLSSISGLERGSLSEIGVVKLIQLFGAVNLELHPKPAGQRRTLDDALNEKFVLNAAQRLSIKQTNEANQYGRINPNKNNAKKQRVRHAKKGEIK
jgi:transcriptional regulator with XRE-family HTH domain